MNSLFKEMPNICQEALSDKVCWLFRAFSAPPCVAKYPHLQNQSHKSRFNLNSLDAHIQLNNRRTLLQKPCIQVEQRQNRTKILIFKNKSGSHYAYYPIQSLNLASGAALSGAIQGSP
jgi:hypothetical protein